MINNTLVVSVLNRSREIGTMRALGATRSFVALNCMIENLILAFISGFCGCLLGVVVTRAITKAEITFTNDFLINVTNVAESEFVNNPIQVGSTAQWVTLTDEHTAFIRGTDYDSRSDVNISEFTTPQGRSYRWINKYLGTWKGGTRIFDSDLPIYRYAEAVLFKAEIEICRHNFTEALTYINQIAKRAYGIDDYYSGTYSQTEIETILLDERLKEFATEGKAWFDLIRFGQVFSRVESLHGRENEENILLWPVNNESINTNPNIKQTPGYD